MSSKKVFRRFHCPSHLSSIARHEGTSDAKIPDFPTVATEQPAPGISDGVVGRTDRQWRGSGVVPVEQRDPTVGKSSTKQEGRGEMIGAPSSLLDLRQRICDKAKTEATRRES